MIQQTGPIPALALWEIEGKLHRGFELYSLTLSQVRGECAFYYRRPWSAMWVNWACFLECPRQQYHFPSGTSACFQTLLVFSHLQSLIPLRIEGRSRPVGGLICKHWAICCCRHMRVSLYRQPINSPGKLYCQLSETLETLEVWPVLPLRLDMNISVSQGTGIIVFS